jgi:hypothetical protein
VCRNPVWPEAIRQQNLAFIPVCLNPSGHPFSSQCDHTQTFYFNPPCNVPKECTEILFDRPAIRQQNLAFNPVCLNPSGPPFSSQCVHPPHAFYFNPPCNVPKECTEILFDRPAIRQQNLAFIPVRPKPCGPPFSSQCVHPPHSFYCYPP